MRRLLAVSTALAAGVLAVPAAAYATSSQAKGGCPVVSDHIAKTDSGHGTPAEWADLSMARKTTICGGPKEGYTVHLVDDGGLMTRTGGGTPNGTGGQITDPVKGAVHGFYDLHVTGTLAVPAHRDTTLSSTVYVTQLFASGATVTGGAYAWTYKTACGEHWTDASTNNDGQGAAAGNITGKVCSTPTPTPTDTSPAPTPSDSTPAPSPTDTTPSGEAPAPTPVKTELPVTG